MGRAERKRRRTLANTGISIEKRQTLGMTKRATKVELSQRVLALVELIATGHSTSSLLRFATAEWGISTRQAEAYVHKARAVIIADIDQDRRQVLAELIASCKIVMRDAIKAQQYNNVIGAVNTLTRLARLDR